MGTIEVINIKTTKILSKNPNDEWIYIGRYNAKFGQSPLKNKFLIEKDGTRDEVVELFRQWLWKNRNDKIIGGELNKIKNMVLEGKNVKLMCWCEPLNCHGRIIKRCIEWMLKPKTKD